METAVGGEGMEVVASTSGFTTTSGGWVVGCCFCGCASVVGLGEAGASELDVELLVSEAKEGGSVLASASFPGSGISYSCPGGGIFSSAGSVSVQLSPVQLGSRSLEKSSSFSLWSCIGFGY